VGRGFDRWAGQRRGAHPVVSHDLARVPVLGEEPLKASIGCTQLTDMLAQVIQQVSRPWPRSIFGRFDSEPDQASRALSGSVAPDGHRAEVDRRLPDSMSESASSQRAPSGDATWSPSLGTRPSCPKSGTSAHRQM
jgi:hypothetical protein